MLHPFHPKLLLLLSQLEGACHDHLDGDRLIVQIRAIILPFLQRIECGLIQEVRSTDVLHLSNVLRDYGRCQEFPRIRERVVDNLRLDHCAGRRRGRGRWWWWCNQHCRRKLFDVERVCKIESCEDYSGDDSHVQQHRDCATQRSRTSLHVVFFEKNGL